MKGNSNYLRPFPSELQTSLISYGMFTDYENEMIELTDNRKYGNMWVSIQIRLSSAANATAGEPIIGVYPKRKGNPPPNPSANLVGRGIQHVYHRT